jgi:4-amino-4-deoxy-L-arabinose transferase-like glycosyltransferase
MSVQPTIQQTNVPIRMSQKRQPRHPQLKIRAGHWMLLFTLLGFGLRVQELSFQPLWGDEGWSFYFATQALPQLVALTAIDIHPPLYYLLLKGWLLIAGTGPEEARFLSVIFGVALIPVVGMLGRRTFDSRVGAAAAAMTALMPLAVYHSQEVRMYGLVTLLGAMSVYAFSRVAPPLVRLSPPTLSTGRDVSSPSPGEGARGRAKSSQRQKWSVAYVLTTTAALYTMYYAVFIPLFQLVYLLLAYAGQKTGQRRPPIWPTLRLFLTMGLLYLPWVIYAAPRLVSYIQNKRAVEGYLPYNIIRFFGDHLVAFSLGHLPPALQSFLWTALPFVILAALGFLAMLLWPRRPYLYLYLYLFLPLIGGYAINQIFPFTPLYYERTLLLAAPAYWLFIAAGLIWLWDRQYLLVGTAVLAMLLVVTVSLTAFYATPRYPHQDYRPLLSDIAARATPEDTLLASYQWQLGFYQAYLSDPRPRLYPVPGWGEGWAGPDGQTQLRADLADIFDQSARLWFPAHQALGHQWEDEAEVAIGALGYPALLEWYSPETKLTLAGSEAASLKELPSANFGNLLHLRSARAGHDLYQAGRGIVPVELVWQKKNNLGSEYRVNLRLVGPAGRSWASRDSHPQAGQSHFTDLSIGDTISDRHGLLIPAGTPPGQYRLLLSVRRVSDAHPLDLLDSNGQPLGAELFLTDIEVSRPAPPVGPAALPVQVQTDATFDRAARLVGFSLGRSPYKAGEPLPVNLFWESLAGDQQPLTVFLELKELNGQQILWREQPPVWPSSEWRQGDLLRDPHDLLLPPTLPPGSYRLGVGLLDAHRNRLPVGRGEDQLLTTVTTIDRPHIFEPPGQEIVMAVSFGDQAQLVGLDLPRRRVKAGEELPLTLYWQALNSFDKNWTVFVHLLDQDGQIVSQQDQIPGGGQFPTTGWVPGEFLTDPYNLRIPADTPPGQAAYHLEIGLYDANDFSRLPVIEAGEIAGDHIFLKNWPITIE